MTITLTGDRADRSDRFTRGRPVFFCQTWMMRITGFCDGRGWYRKPSSNVLGPATPLPLSAVNVGPKGERRSCEHIAAALVEQPSDLLFLMGTEPDFAAVRFFREDDGWVGDFTGDAIAASFPDFDALASS